MQRSLKIGINMTVEFVRIADDSNSEPIEIPTEENGTLCLSSVSGKYFSLFFV